MKLKIIQNRKYYYIISGMLVLASLVSLFVWGLKPGIDFTGGSLMQLSFGSGRPGVNELRQELSDFDIGDIQIQPAGDKDMIFRFGYVNENTHKQILEKIQNKYAIVDEDQGVVSITVSEKRFEAIGPVIGQEIKRKAWIAILLTVLAIVLYIAYIFRRVTKPVSSWKYGISAIVALVHDILIVAGLFSVLGYFAGVEVDALFITALLTILGFSVNDTIVVFDRTRENLIKHYSGDFEEVVNDSVNQTISRSVNTSLTTLLILLSLYFFGGATIANFVLALIAGVVVGTYSSIFIASPIMVSWYKSGK